MLGKKLIYLLLLMVTGFFIFSNSGRKIVMNLVGNTIQGKSTTPINETPTTGTEKKNDEDWTTSTGTAETDSQIPQDVIDQFNNDFLHFPKQTQIPLTPFK